MIDGVAHCLHNVACAVPAVALVFLTGCLWPSPGRLAEEEYPVLERLEQGDVILMFSPNLLSLLFSRLGTAPGHEPPLPLSHAELLARGENGNWTLVGISGSRLQSRSLLDSLTLVSHIYVFRAESSTAKRREAARFAHDWTRRPGADEVGFDYATRDIPGRHSEFYCAGFLNEVCRLTSLPPPFFVQERPSSAVGRYLKRICGAEPNRTPGIASIFANPDYRQVLTWHHPRLGDPDQMLITGGIADAVFSFCEQGWLPKGVELLRHHSALPVETQRRTLGAGRRRLLFFSSDVRRMWDRLKRRGRTAALDAKSREELVQRICRKYREKHFYHFTACDDRSVAHGMPDPVSGTAD